MAEVVCTESAIIDLDETGEYISQDSVKYAELTVQSLFESTDILESNPLTGPVVPELQNDSISQLIRGSFRLIYHVVEEELIEVLTVHRTSRLIGNTYDFENLINE